jgi:hypothetical protein
MIGEKSRLHSLTGSELLRYKIAECSRKKINLEKVKASLCCCPDFRPPGPLRGCDSFPARRRYFASCRLLRSAFEQTQYLIQF